MLLFCTQKGKKLQADTDYSGLHTMLQGRNIRPRIHRKIFKSWISVVLASQLIWKFFACTYSSFFDEKHQSCHLWTDRVLLILYPDPPQQRLYPLLSGF